MRVNGAQISFDSIYIQFVKLKESANGSGKKNIIYLEK